MLGIPSRPGRADALQHSHFPREAGRKSPPPPPQKPSRAMFLQRLPLGGGLDVAAEGVQEGRSNYPGTLNAPGFTDTHYYIIAMTSSVVYGFFSVAPNRYFFFFF